ncbi:MAG: xanthine dehydrogenase family protein subunit M [Gammaproteobacteria bacterium]|nr:xanthine dehydrogenase family protein subunit M [Gammaproteobacteria bacterium]MDE0257708.1 xanthine dehydrogenase family protein subunit M [Gammaproteobacteria bacterium]
MMKDMMPHFDLVQPTDVESALDLLREHGRDAWALAGGYDSFDWFKNRGKQPSVVVDLEGLDELRGVRENGEGIEIGAMTSLTDVENDPVVRDRYGLLAEAVSVVASPQIRNAGTLGGNLCQDTRCWYYRYGMPCYRAGGNVCYAGAPDAMNREHALFGADRCVAVTPSDSAPALVALDAEMVVRNARGERVIPAGEFFMPPGVDITRMTVLDPGDLLTAVRIPARWAGARFHFEKVSDRKTWDFPLVNVAAAFRVADGRIDDSRIVLGAVECIPRRLTDVEDLVRGRVPNETTADEAGELATEGARPLDYNHFKIPLVKNLVARAVRSA